MRNGELSAEEREEIRRLLLEDDDDDESIDREIKTASNRKTTKRIFYLQKYFENNQGRYIKMSELQEKMDRAGYPNSIKTIYKDLDVLKEQGVKYDYREKAYILPKPHKENDVSDIILAMNRDRKISFKPFHWTTDRSTPKKYSNKGEPIIGSPWEISQRDGKQYVYVFLDDKKVFRTYRTDRIDDVQILDTHRAGESEYKEEKEREQQHTRKEAKVFNNYKGKKVYNVRIRFINKLLEQVYDEFGRDIVFIRDDDGKHFMITQPISVSPTFYAWIATFGHSVKILYPPEVVDGMRQFLQDAADMYKNDGEM